MTIYKFTNLTLPPTLEKRRETLEAFRTLTWQDDEFVQRRRAEIAAIRREMEDIRRCIDAIRRQMPELRAQLQRELKAQKYSPDQPRVPAGNPQGGEWTSEGSSGSSNSFPANAVTSVPRGPQYAQADTGTRSDGVMLVGDDGIVKPRGLIVAPGPASLDPERLNGPLSTDEQQKIADTLSLIYAGNTSALEGHAYENRPHDVTGAVLPPASDFGYVAYDVPGLNTGTGPRGLNRLVIDLGTGAIYYTNNHYASFYPVDLVPGGR